MFAVLLIGVLAVLSTGVFVSKLLIAFSNTSFALFTSSWVEFGFSYTAFAVNNAFSTTAYDAFV